jgi:four helix bundle protein
MGKKTKEYDLEDRLIDFAVAMIDTVEALPSTRAGNHIAGQLLRSGTSPAPNYGEAQSAESRKDFIHKMKIALKELRETRVWLRIILKKVIHKACNSSGVGIFGVSGVDPYLCQEHCDSRIEEGIENGRRELPSYKYLKIGH